MFLKHIFVIGKKNINRYYTLAGNRTQESCLENMKFTTSLQVLLYIFLYTRWESNPGTLFGKQEVYH
jgi:hypothetical protein